MNVPMIPPTPSGAAYRAIPDELTMTTDRFLRILDKLNERRRQPHGDWCFVALALTLAFLFPLVTTQTYRAAFGFSPNTWEAFTLLGAMIFGAAFICLLARFGYIMLKFPAKSSEQILAEVIHEMERERARAAARAAELSAASRVAVDQAVPAGPPS